MLTQDELKKILHYDPETGIFTHLTGRRAGCQAGKADINNPHSMVYIALGGKSFTAGKLAWLYMTGEYPSVYVYHRNTDSHDNRWLNLCLDTDQLGGSNRTPVTRSQ